jgi:6-pyruvoyltetrahydropterin/6-carboxytetrahydropterin synthase
MQPDRCYQVKVEGIQFAAAHFATFKGGCEPLHGHNYEVAAVVEGTLQPDSWVFDFVELKTILRGFCRELDHRFMLQGKSRLLKVESRGNAWAIQTPSGSEYLLPDHDVILLPIDNTTAERLAEWLCERLCQALKERGAGNIMSIYVEVAEGPGQRAGYRLENACR